MNYRIHTLGRLCAMGSIAIAGMQAGVARANCTASTPGTYTIGQGVPIVVRGDVAPGTVIATSRVESVDKQWAVDCTSGTKTFTSKITGTTGDTFPVRVAGQGVGENAGVGLQIVITELAASGGDGVAHELPWTMQRTFSGLANLRIKDNVDYKLVRLSGPVRYGKAIAESVATSVASPGAIGTFRKISINDLILARPSCSISASSLNQQVDLGAYTSSQFSRPGDSSPWIKFRLVSENCDDPTGMIADITFGTSTDADLQNAALYNVLPGPVRGVGIQLARDTAGSEPILPGQLTSMPAVATGQFYGFKSRLQRTSASLVPGGITKPLVVQVDFR